MNKLRSGLLTNKLRELLSRPQSIFLTGATGFVGRRLVSVLTEKGHHISAMIRPGKVLDERLPAAVEQVPLALSDVDGLAGVVAEVDAVIYCAGSVRGRQPADFAVANVEGVKAMISALARLPKAPPLLLISSLAASRPELSDYSRSKYAAEQLLQTCTERPWTIIRPPAIYGPGDKEMLPLLKLAGKGLVIHPGPPTQRLSLLHVDDLAAAVAAWLENWQACLSTTYAIDDGKPGGYDWAEIGEAASDGKYRLLKIPTALLSTFATVNARAAKLFGYAPMLTPGKVQELLQTDWLCADNQSFNAATGWQPNINLQQGVAALLAKLRYNSHA